MKYEFILFDLDNTLFDFDKAEKNAFYKTLENFDIHDDLEVLRDQYHEINLQLWDEFRNNQISAQDLRTERFSRFCQLKNYDLAPPEMSKYYLKFLSQGTFLIENAEEVVSALGSRKKALITNGFAEVQYPRLEKSALAPYFKEIFISEEIGYAKPHPAIFEFVFEKMGHEHYPSSLIIGDSLNSDIKGGNDFGIDTCWFNLHDKENQSEIIPDYEIKELRELIDIFAR